MKTSYSKETVMETIKAGDTVMRHGALGWTLGKVEMVDGEIIDITVIETAVGTGVRPGDEVTWITGQDHLSVWQRKFMEPAKKEAGSVTDN